MRTLIVYDSVYGNTQEVAHAIRKGIQGNVKVKYVTEANNTDIDTIDLLIIGSPVHGGTYTPEIGAFISAIPPEKLRHIKIATFDTRFASEEHGMGLRFLMYVIRFASEKMAQVLKKKGATLIAKPEGFIVKDKEGPLKENELERATYWGKALSYQK